MKVFITKAIWPENVIFLKYLWEYNWLCYCKYHSKVFNLCYLENSRYFNQTHLINFDFSFQTLFPASRKTWPNLQWNAP